MNVEEATLIDSIADCAMGKTDPLLLGEEDAVLLNRLIYAPPMYVHWSMDARTAKLLQRYPDSKRNLTMNQILWKRLREVRLGGRPLRVTRRMALGLLSLFDVDRRREAGDDTEDEDLEQ